MSGFEAAFTAPMTITGSARIYSLFTSQAVFNGLVTIMISTDGKFMVHGQLNFAEQQPVHLRPPVRRPVQARRG